MTENARGKEGPVDFGWSILELMGHRRLAGKLCEVAIAGAGMLRLDVPAPDGSWVTQFYGGSAVYCITPTTEEIARAVARGARPEPVHRWELPAQAATVAAERTDGDEDGDGDGVDPPWPEDVDEGTGRTIEERY
jgi:hypothetical protein